ncbi:MAG: hypothetical protein U9O53_01005 [archaeon]|nr:hypothetical protein [archaeon]
MEYTLPLTAHLSKEVERKTVAPNSTPAKSQSSLTANNELIQTVSIENVQDLLGQGYPYTYITGIPEPGKSKIVIHNFDKDILLNTIDIEETITKMPKHYNNGREILQEIKFTKEEDMISKFMQQINTYSSWDSEQGTGKTVIESTFFSNGNIKENTRLGSEKTTLSKSKIGIEELEKHPGATEETLKEKLHIHRKDKNRDTFFSSFREKIENKKGKNPEDIYLKDIIRTRQTGPELKELLGYLESAPLYPFEGTEELTRTYTGIEFIYGNRCIEAFYFSPSEETGRKPVYMGIIKGIKIKDRIESTEKYFFIDSDMTAVLDHLIYSDYSFTS